MAAPDLDDGLQLASDTRGDSGVHVDPPTGSVVAGAERAPIREVARSPGKRRPRCFVIRDRNRYLVQARKRLRLSQRALARAAFVKLPTVQALEFREYGRALLQEDAVRTPGIFPATSGKLRDDPLHVDEVTDRGATTEDRAKQRRSRDVLVTILIAQALHGTRR